MSASREVEVGIEKGGGREQLIAELEMALCVAGVRVHPGRYVIRIERAPKTEGTS